MTLAKQQWLFLAAALALLTALIATLVFNQQSIERSVEDLKQAQDLVSIIVRMRNIAVEASIDRTEREEKQWRAGMRDLAPALKPMRTAFPEEILLMRRITTNVEDADQLFQRLLASYSPGQTGVTNGGATDSVLGRTARALHVVLGDVSLMALQMAEMQTVEIREARAIALRTQTFLLLAMLGILFSFPVVFRIFVLAPIKHLETATDRVAAGDLEHRVDLKTRNEFGKLGQRFDHMTGELQVSRDRMDAANKELEAFAYSVSHDLRAPLRGMDAFSRILLEKHASRMDDDARHCLQMIRDNAVQMGHLIDDLLTFSRLSRQPLRKELVSHEPLVHAALAQLEAEQQGRQIDLVVGELPAAEADPRLLKQVWINLIGNAFKYTRGRERAVIRIGSEMQEGVPVYFVQDNGVGFDMRYAHKLFGVFQRLHRAEDYEGTGVGLAIVQRIVARHGGRIWTRAAKNEGATFYFTLQGADGHAQ